LTFRQPGLTLGRLRIAPGLAEAATLTKELADYPVKISASGHDTFNAREGQHDDLVLAVSTACWYRDDISQHYDDHIADQQQAARVTERAEWAHRLASRSTSGRHSRYPAA
jgi:hypothetical protein